MSMPTLLDVVRRNGTDDAVGLIEEASKATPEVALGGARSITGLNYRARVRTAVPTVNFRSSGEGTAVDHSTYEQRLFECYLLNPQFEVDKADADAAEDGAGAYLAEEALGIMEGAFQALGTAFFYGQNATVGKGAKSFPGLLDQYDADNMTVDAGGTTDDVASSVWFVRWHPQGTRWLLGLGGKAEVTDPEAVRLIDTNSNPYTGYRQELYLRPGLQVGHLKSVARIKKLTTDNGKGLTDALIDSAMALFPAGKPPTVAYMSTRSRKQWKNSRTATTPTGAPAPWPDIIDGPEGPIPVKVTDSILNTEKLALV